MRHKKNFRMFATQANTVTESLSPLANSGTGTKFRYDAIERSPLIVKFIQGDKQAMQHYDKYLANYNAAVRYLSMKDYERARINIESARSSLFKADIAPALTGADLGLLENLSNALADNLPQSKC